MTRDRTNFWTHCATAFRVGYIPFAPGTWGSLPGIVIALAAHKLALTASGGTMTGFGFYGTGALLGAAMTAFALFAIDRTEKLWMTHDDKRIVIDEVVGQAIALTFVPPTWTYLLIGFALFRFLDIVKPWPIGMIDRELPGAFGTLMDDVVAGAVVALVLIWFHWGSV